MSLSVYLGSGHVGAVAAEARSEYLLERDWVFFSIPVEFWLHSKGLTDIM